MIQKVKKDREHWNALITFIQFQFIHFVAVPSESTVSVLAIAIRPVVPNRGAIYSAQGCRGLARFLPYH